MNNMSSINAQNTDRTGYPLFPDGGEGTETMDGQGKKKKERTQDKKSCARKWIWGRRKKLRWTDAIMNWSSTRLQTSTRELCMSEEFSKLQP
jgi:hypothetical protein